MSKTIRETQELKDDMDTEIASILMKFYNDTGLGVREVIVEGEWRDNITGPPTTLGKIFVYHVTTSVIL